MPGWMKHKLESRLLGEISVTSDIQMIPTHSRMWKGTKEPLEDGERGEWNSWLKTQHSCNNDHGIQSHHFVANRWENNGNSERLYFGGAPKSLQMVTAAMKLKDACFLEEKLWPTNLDRILKSRDIPLPTKVHLVKAMVFPVVMYGCESWTIKKAEHRRSDAFELWWWRRLVRVPWTARRSNQSILKEISPEYSLERLLLKLKLQYFGHLMQRANSLEKTQMLGKIEGGKRSGWQRMRWLGGITDLMDMSLSKLWEWTGKPGMLQSTGSQRVRHDWVTELKSHV